MGDTNMEQDNQIQTIISNPDLQVIPDVKTSPFITDIPSMDEIKRLVFYYTSQKGRWPFSKETYDAAKKFLKVKELYGNMDELKDNVQQFIKRHYIFLKVEVLLEEMYSDDPSTERVDELTLLLGFLRSNLDVIFLTRDYSWLDDIAVEIASQVCGHLEIAQYVAEVSNNSGQSEEAKRGMVKESIEEIKSLLPYAVIPRPIQSLI